MTMNLEPITTYIKDIESEIAILKTVHESCTAKDYEFVPMVVFYTNSETKDLVVAPAHYRDLTEKMVSIAECLHLYAAIHASAAYVAMQSKLQLNDIEYNAITISVVCNERAWNISLPYTVENNTVTWHNEMSTLHEFDDDIADDVSKDIINMFYNFTHLEAISFTAAEILSYLSSKGAAIEMFAGNYHYFSLESK